MQIGNHVAQACSDRMKQVHARLAIADPDLARRLGHSAVVLLAAQDALVDASTQLSEVFDWAHDQFARDASDLDALAIDDHDPRALSAVQADEVDPTGLATAFRAYRQALTVHYGDTISAIADLRWAYVVFAKFLLDSLGAHLAHVVQLPDARYSKKATQDLARFGGEAATEVVPFGSLVALLFTGLEKVREILTRRLDEVREAGEVLENERKDQRAVVAVGMLIDAYAQWVRTTLAALKSGGTPAPPDMQEAAAAFRARITRFQKQLSETPAP